MKPARVPEKRLLDQPHRARRADLVEVLEAHAKLAALLKSTELLEQTAAARLQKIVGQRRGATGPLHVAVPGCGEGWPARAVAAAARRARVPVIISAIEPNPTAAAAARESCAPVKSIRVVGAEPRAILSSAHPRDPERSDSANPTDIGQPQCFDLIIAASFLGRFADVELSAWFHLFSGASRHGWIALEWTRTLAARVIIERAAAITSSKPAFRADVAAAVGMRRTEPEWLRLASTPGLAPTRVAHRGLVNLILSGRELSRKH